METPTEAMRDNMVGQGYNPTDAQINQQLNILKEKVLRVLLIQKLTVILH